ncbi:MAG: transposase family protein, partial [Actinomycetia bacterium]|nr:transposase family protein [Actinomycetes bacterium]
RYGCIFTCMNVRAIHLEKLNTLETESFINGMRRFISRRGLPKKIFSDNGTNFVGANSEIKTEFRNFLTKREIDWSFNPPHASHMGGVWERQIRTIRKVLQALLDKFKGELTDEILETLLRQLARSV